MQTLRHSFAIYIKAKLWIVSTLKSGDNMVELRREAYQKMTESYLNRVIVRLIDNFLYSMKKENEEDW